MIADWPEADAISPPVGFDNADLYGEVDNNVLTFKLPFQLSK